MISQTLTDSENLRLAGPIALCVYVCVSHVVLACLQVELVQTVVDGVNLVIEMEKALENGKSIDNLIPK